MTIEEKAKAYDEGIEGIQEILSSGQDSIKMSRLQLRLQGIFPELKDKENKDERIRKELHIYLDWLDGRKDYAPRGEYTIRDMIAWLEKQKISEDTIKRDNKMVAEFPYTKEECTNSKLVALSTENEKGKTEPKFNEGEWITYEEPKTAKIIFFNCGRYGVENIDGTKGFPQSDYIDKNFHLWTIQDAKDGDVLADKDNNIGIFQECEGTYWNSYIYLGCDGELRGFGVGGMHEQTDTHPAAKEQRDLLFTKMKKAGYEWDAKKKELNKLK